MKDNQESHFRFIDLFAGIGGIRLGLQSQGGRCVFSSEWDKDAQKTYAHNHGDQPVGDITQVDTANIPDFDVLGAGFPCQPFSSIGKREGFRHPTQGTLFYDVVRIIEAKRPKAFLLENVEGLITHENGGTFQTILDSLAVSVNGQPILFPSPGHLGYHVYWKLLDSKHFGLPQSRVRVFIVGFDATLYEDPSFRFPEKHADLTPVGPYVEQGRTGYSISEHLQQSYLFKLEDGKPQLIDPCSDFPVKTLVSSYHKIQRLTGTFVRDEGSETGIRLLSENECKAIMGYPADFEFPVSRTQMYRQLGNSVAVKVIEELAREMKAVFGSVG